MIHCSIPVIPLWNRSTASEQMYIYVPVKWRSLKLNQDEAGGRGVLGGGGDAPTGDPNEIVSKCLHTYVAEIISF